MRSLVPVASMLLALAVALPAAAQRDEQHRAGASTEPATSR
jgi:hypothetical protein